MEAWDPDLQCSFPLLVRLDEASTHVMTSAHPLTPRSVSRLKAHPIHALNQPILQFAPNLHAQFP